MFDKHPVFIMNAKIWIGKFKLKGETVVTYWPIVYSYPGDILFASCIFQNIIPILTKLGSIQSFM